MEKRYTLKDWLDGKIALNFDSKEEFNKFAKLVEPYGICWRGRENFKFGILCEVVLDFRDNEERIASWGADSRYVSVNFKDLDICKQRIYITHDTKTVTAIYTDVDFNKYWGKAMCSPQDNFDFFVGASLALQRLADEIKKETFKPYLLGDDGKICGYIGEKTDLKDKFGNDLCVGDDVIYLSGTSFIAHNIVVFRNNKFYVNGYGSISDKEKLQKKLVKIKSYDEFKDGDVCDHLEYVLTEREGKEVKE